MDITLNFTEQGSGFPLILLHGNGENSDYFCHQMAYFAQKYRVIAIDTRGHGGSPRGAAPFTLQQFAEDLHDFMVARGIARAHILGFSDGGNIALLFALKYPDFVERLVLNGANLNPAGVKIAVQLPVTWGYYLASFFGKISEPARKKAEILGLMVNEPHITGEMLETLSMPVLVIAGTKDMIKDDHTREIAGAIKGAALKILDGDHFIAAKCPEAFNTAVASFLGE